MFKDRAFNANDRLSSTATLTVSVIDVNDADPVFEYAGCARNVIGVCAGDPAGGGAPRYSASVKDGIVAASGFVSVLPERIHAVDTDSSKSQIRYAFRDGSPHDYGEYFEINPVSGSVKQIKAVSRSQVDKFDIVVMVTDN